MLSMLREGTNPPLKRGLILTFFRKVSLVFSWVCPQSHKYLVEQGPGPAECLTTKLQAVYLFSFSGSYGAT